MIYSLVYFRVLYYFLATYCPNSLPVLTLCITVRLSTSYSCLLISTPPFPHSKLSNFPRLSVSPANRALCSLPTNQPSRTLSPASPSSEPLYTSLFCCPPSPVNLPTSCPLPLSSTFYHPCLPYAFPVPRLSYFLFSPGSHA